MINLDTLFRVRSGLKIIAVIAIIVYLMFPELSWFSLFALVISMHQFALLFNSIGYIIPIRYLFGAFMCLQMLVGPMLAYNGLDQFQRGHYKMQIPEADYFSYVIPAVICFIIGLHVTSKKLNGEFLEIESIRKFVFSQPSIPYILVAVGFISSLIAAFFSSELAFVFTLLGGFKFIGALMFVLGSKSFKPIPVFIVFGSILLSSLSEGMFHDLLTWVLFLGAVLAIKFKPKDSTKAVFVFSFCLLAAAIQQIKGDYREATWQKGEEAGISTISKAYEESQTQNQFLSYKSLAQSSIRINQGFIITNIMKTVPSKILFSDGEELKQIVEAAILPRIIAPNKLTAGNRDIFVKYSGMPLSKGTSMGLSSVGDAYINFGIFGGSIFMFFYGLLFSEVLKAFHRYSKYYPTLLLFTPLVFYYPIRPDCELQTILGHLVKSCFLIYVVFTIWKKYFTIYLQPPEKDIHPDTLVPASL